VVRPAILLFRSRYNKFTNESWFCRHSIKTNKSFPGRWFVVLTFSTTCFTGWTYICLYAKQLLPHAIKGIPGNKRKKALGIPSFKCSSMYRSASLKQVPIAIITKIRCSISVHSFEYFSDMTTVKATEVWCVCMYIYDLHKTFNFLNVISPWTTRVVLPDSSESEVMLNLHRSMASPFLHQHFGAYRSNLLASLLYSNISWWWGQSVWYSVILSRMLNVFSSYQTF
jgi:hypothetical protein